MENKPASLLVVSLGKALNGTPPPLCGRQVALPVLHQVTIVKLLTQHVRRLQGTHQWQSALLVVGLPVTQDWFEMGCHLSPSPGVGKLFSRRAALTISRVVEGQGLLSRTAACYRRNCISSQFCEMFWQCGISARKIGGVSKKKKKRSSPFRRR